MDESGNSRALKYLYGGVSAVFAVLTYLSFNMFQAQASFSIHAKLLNFLIMFGLWFTSLRRGSDFSNGDYVLFIVLPFIGLSVSNLLLHLTVIGSSLPGLLLYILTGGLTIFTARKSSD